LQIIASKVEQQQSEYQLASKVEQQQIEYQLQKKNLQKTTPVITEQDQKIFCHSCATRTELSIKKFFYIFADGKSVFFCNAQEKNLWLKIYKLNS